MRSALRRISVNFAGILVIVAALFGGFVYLTSGKCIRYHVEISNLSQESIENLRLSIGDQIVWRAKENIDPDEGVYLPVFDPFMGPFVLTGVYGTTKRDFTTQTPFQTWEYLQDYEVMSFSVDGNTATSRFIISDQYGPIYGGSGNPKGFHYSCLDSDVMQILKASFDPQRLRALLRDFPVIR